jgi:hypothetical protein
MARLAPITCIAGALAALATGSGCAGERIKLGNGQPLLVDGSACPHAQVSASQVVWIGDSWVTIPGNQHTGVRDLARAAGAIGPGDDYTIDAANGALIGQIAVQYTSQEATAIKAKVLIMDGGTLDTIMMDTSATVTSVANTFTQLLSTVADDGTVTAIIYFLMPELPNIPGVAALRPLLQQACTQSTVPCFFLDLQPLWVGHPEYTDTASGGIFPTDAGGTVIADAIWGLMQSNCIAQ